MVNFVSQLMPWAVLFSNVLAAILFLALIFKSRGALWVGRHAIALGLIVSAAAVFGSLFYSNVVGFEPCLLCWWQRIAIYPIFVLLLVAIWKNDRGVFRYVLPLSLMAFVLSVYHSYVQWGGSPLIPCDATASCSKLYVFAFGYITIPTMVLSVAVLMLLLTWANRIYENSHSR